ncbi:C25 family cysteine peptidase [Frigoriglobus tundricola]|uniref:Gingipain domain-containing protein n=1 Tax=Frigoriglobus tundricola TaxID=2774151 RepID=A0A6M5YWD1_9BACT|nr:C25 family cysteine peptidase [Frigoriglobus tundricola]QJW98407.1 hypothetical protein FTUN_5997 [Frigoriglobus tundricola]
MRRRFATVLLALLGFFVTARAIGQEKNFPLTSALKARVDVSQVGQLRAVCRTGSDFWIGGEKGLFRWSSGEDTLKPTAYSKTVNCLQPAQSHLWVGTPEGLFQFYPASGSFAATPIKSPEAVFCLTRTSQPAPETLWIGVYCTGNYDNGLYRWTNGEREPTSMKLGKNRTVNDLVANGDSLWIGAQGFPNGGLYYWHAGDNKPAHRENWTQKGIQRLQPFGRSLLVTDVAEFQLFRLDPLPLTNPPGPPQRIEGVGPVQSLHSTRDTLWVGTNSGLFRWRSNEEGPKDTGLVPWAVKSFYRDGDALWVVAERGLFRIDGFDNGPWNPKIVIDAKPGWFNTPDTSISIKWHVGDYAARTTQDLVRFQVSLQNDDTGETLSKERLIPARFDFSHEPLPPGRYTYEVRAFDLDDRGGSTWATGSIRVFSYRWWWGAGTLFVVMTALLGILVIYVPARRWLLVHLFGLRYSLIPGYCPNEVFIRREEHDGDVTGYSLYYRTNSAVRIRVAIGQESGSLQNITALNTPRSELSGGQILAIVDEQDFDQPWGQLIGDRWSQTCPGRTGVQSPVIAGQVMLKAGPPHDRRESRIQFAILGCFAPSNVKLETIPADDYLNSLGHLRSTARRVGKVTNKLDAMQYATVKMFEAALQEADIILFVGHGDSDRLHLEDGPLPSTKIENTPTVRCRLMILDACSTASLDGFTRGTFARALVSKGVHVIAATETITANFTSVFFPALFLGLLPATGPTTGNDLAGAIRLGVTAWRNSPKWNATDRSLDAFLLFGDPSLRITFTKEVQ